MENIRDVSGGADDTQSIDQRIVGHVNGPEGRGVIDLTDQGIEDFDFGRYDSLQSKGPYLHAKGSGLRMGRRGFLVAGSVVVAAGAVFAGFLLAVSTPPLADLPAEVTNTGQISMGFPTSGVISSLPVRAGETVSKGQTLATIIAPGVGGGLAQAKSALAASEGEENTLRGLLGDTTAQIQEAKSSYVAQLSTSVSDAQNALATAQQEDSAVTSADNGVISQAQSSLAMARADANLDCQGVPPITGTPDPSQLACQNATVAVGQDQLSLAQAQAAAANNTASYQAVVAQDTKELSDAQAALSQARDTGLTDTVSLRSQLAQIQAQVVEDRAAVEAAEAKTGVETLTASASGTVMVVNGAIGEVTGQSGALNASPSGSQLDVTKGFQLFPSAQGVSQSSSGSSPLIVLKTSNQATVDTLVPQAQIGAVRIGEKAVFTPAVAGLKSLEGTVAQIFPKPTEVNGVVSYEVQVSISHTRGEYPDGVTGNVTISQPR